MNVNRIILFFIVSLLLSCKPQTKTNQNAENLINTKVELTGIAYDSKGGAIIDCNGTHYWIEGVESWEDKFRNKKIIITGILEKRADNPVFLDTSDVKIQGIPVYSEEELEKQQNRYWIKNPEIKLAK